MPKSIRTFPATLLVLVATTASARILPDVPAIERDVTLMRSEEFTYPHIPPLRTTADGRVGIGPKGNRGMVDFYVMVPEQIAAPFVTGPQGDRILAGLTPYRVPESAFHNATDPRRRHYALCDATAEHYTAGESTSPYGCGASGRDDCYDFVIVTSTSFGFGSKRRQLWGTPVTVRVSSPKTADAALAQVVTGPPRPGPILAAEHLFEPTTTNDGRLLSARVGTGDFEWMVPETGERRRHRTDLVYSFNASKAPCDVSGWTTFYPISHAPHDPEVSSRYGFAMYPFRDSTGQILPAGDDLGISYPWIDRHGRNLFYTSIGDLLSLDGILPAGDDGRTHHPTRCVPDIECSARREYFDRTRGQGVVGLWTRGKMVLLDGILNNTDYGLEHDDAAHRLIQLYRAGSGSRGDESGEVRVGAGRGAGFDAPSPATYVGNATLVDSLENLFHAFPPLRPVMPRDVTWIVNSGRASDEVAFDDWLDLDAFIVSEMVGATSYTDLGSGAGVMTHHNGSAGGESGGRVWIQNAATALPDRWRVPDAGIAAGEVRVEPVALGGIRGKGLWLDGRSGVTYEIAEQPVDTNATAWYLGIFLDSRFADDGVERTLVGFPNGARIALRGRRSVAYSRADGTTAHEIDLGVPLRFGAWTHLGFQLTPDGGIVFHRDGFALDRTSGESAPGFAMSPGKLSVGDDPRDSSAGVRGWIDDFIVIARELDPEQACNRAAGTLAALGPHGEPLRWVETAQAYPAWAHESIGQRLGAGDQRYVCFHGYERDYHNHPAEIPRELRPVRQELTFPEGPLQYGRPRPDSSNNPFCLTCHSADGRGGLHTAALVERRGEPMEDDRRRQPSQPPRRVFGNVPAHWLGPGKPASDVEAPPAGLKIDALMEGAVAAVEAPDRLLEPCAGDCNGDRRVSVGELTLAVRIAQGASPFGLCRQAFDCAASDTCLGIAQLTRAISNALDGCPTAAAPPGALSIYEPR